MSSCIQIRRAGRADAGDLTRIAHAAKRHWGYPAAWIRLWEPDLTVTPATIARSPVYCAQLRRRVVGFYALTGRGSSRELAHMWVRPSHMGRGVGRTLFAHCCERLRAMAVTRLEVVSDPNAEGFYRRMGARRVGRVASTPTGRYLPRLVLRLRPRP